MVEMTCIVCPRGCNLMADVTPEGILVTGNSCARGIPYAQKELTHPTRVVTSTVRIRGALHSRLPVKTSRDIPKGLNFEVMKALETVTVDSPVAKGTVLIRDILGTGADIIATRTL
ncbi:MAG TPA: DUF1667 domain-containing protein [Clostridiaceae bacterium]|nr:DUF1667 domain-containing protein [Clostridiaceae bacterium]